MIRVLLIDDHAIVRLGIRSLLEARGDYEVVGEAGSRREALTMLNRLLRVSKKYCPDVAVVDLVLGNDDGLDFVKELKHLCPDMRILVVTMQNEAVYAERVIRAGAHGFLHKKDAIQRLPDALEAFHRGERYLSRASRMRIQGGSPREPDPGPDGVGSLSDRELHVFQMVGTGLSNKDIAAHLHLSTKTIETHKEHIKRKLDLPDAAALRASAVRWVETGRR